MQGRHQAGPQRAHAPVRRTPRPSTACFPAPSPAWGGREDRGREGLQVQAHACTLARTLTRMHEWHCRGTCACAQPGAHSFKQRALLARGVAHPHGREHATLAPCTTPCTYTSGVTTPHAYNTHARIQYAQSPREPVRAHTLQVQHPPRPSQAAATFTPQATTRG